MEDSRKSKRSRKKGLPTPDPHVDGGNGKKAIIYNTKRGKRGGGGKKRTKKKEKERKKAKGLKKYNSKRKEFSTLSHNIRACPRIFSV